MLVLVLQFRVGSVVVLIKHFGLGIAVLVHYHIEFPFAKDRLAKEQVVVLIVVGQFGNPRRRLG